MEKFQLQVFEKVGSEARTRQNADRLEIKKLEEYSEITINFEKVNFISRSFADEMLAQLAENHITYHLKNENDIVRNMISAVSAGRGKTRLRPNSKSEIVHITNMRELSEILNVSL